MKATINNVQIAYDDHGVGLPVIFLHAFPLNRRMCAGELMALLGEGRYRLVALDWRGFGESEITNGISTMELFAGDVAGLMDALGIQNAILCGLSMGGYAAFAFLPNAGDRGRAGCFDPSCRDPGLCFPHSGSAVRSHSTGRSSF